MPNRNGDVSSLRVTWRLAAYPLRYKWHLAGVYVCLTVSSLIALVIPRLLGVAIDETLASGLRSQHMILAAGIIAMGLLRAGFGWAQLLLTYVVHVKAVRDLQIELFHKLLGLGFGYYDRQRTGDLMSRVMTDVSLPQLFLNMGLSRAAAMAVILAVIALLMLSMNWRLGLVSLGLISIYMWRVLSKSGGLQEIWRRVQAETGTMNAVMEESLAGMRVVKAFGAGQHEEAKFEPRASAISDYTYRGGRYWALRSSIFFFIATLAVGNDTVARRA